MYIVFRVQRKQNLNVSPSNLQTSKSDKAKWGVEPEVPDERPAKTLRGDGPDGIALWEPSRLKKLVGVIS
jgi:hypothetical protein